MTSEEREGFFQFQTPDEASLHRVFGNDLPRLDELRRRYAAFDSPASPQSVWAHRKFKDNLVSVGLDGVDLARFRANGSYVWNYYGPASSETARLKYFLYREAVKATDDAGLLNSLTEDGAFGCPTVEFDGSRLVSRDLLDSVAEINFLQRQIGVLDRGDLHVLDIGAGYGRMAHRMLEANPLMTGYTCVDAVPESTFLSEFYLKFRGLADRSTVLPFDEVDGGLDGPFDVALNIHSFSECTYSAVEWWMQHVRTLDIPYVLIVPNPHERFGSDEERFVTTEPDGSAKNYHSLLGELGYELHAREAVIRDAEARALLGVEDLMFLFKLRS